MHPNLQQRFDALEERRKALVARVRALPLEKQQAKPGGGAFSAAEVIAHFGLTEDNNVGFMRKDSPASLRGKKPKVTFMFKKVVSGMENPGKPMNTVRWMVPKEAVDLDAADRRWAEIRQELRGFLEQVEKPEDPLVKMLFFFGTPSADDFLRLCESHMTYHERRFPV